uniref:alpha-1,2-fucosyltransferase n=1 Tax=Treponema sp. TaxID=166 RepID=UPI00298D60B4
DVKANFISRVKKHFFKKSTHIIEDNSVLFEISKLDISKDWYLDGYWQAIWYFKNSVSELKELFFPLKQYQVFRSNIEKRFPKMRLCSVHVRRGDYVKDGVMSCQDISWYFKCIEEYKQKFPESKIILVSDDIPFCKEQFSKYNYVSFCDWNKTSFDDLYTLAVCDDHILSNSTFSYWGALLSRQEGITVYPANWFGIGDAKLRGDTMFPEEWLCEE